MALLCPECLNEMVFIDSETARCPAHGVSYRLLFARAPVHTPVPPLARMAFQASGASSTLDLAVASEVPGAAPPQLAADARCQNHPEIQAVAICKFCAAPLCETCDFALPGDVHACSNCAATHARPRIAAQCQTHPDVQAVAICQSCGAPVCQTCDFVFPGDVHVCPTCAVTPTRQLSSGRKKLAYWSIGLGIWSTAWLIIPLVLMASGAGPASNSAREAIGNLLGILSLLPNLVGLALGFASFEKRMSSTIAMWIGTIWNGTLMAVWILLIIIGITRGG